MGIVTLLMIAVGLAMDAFAVSVSSGIVLCHIKIRQNFKIAGSFGLFQGIMPLIGYAIANTFADKIQAVDHWIAFGLLAFVGGKMLWEAVRGVEESQAAIRPRGKTFWSCRLRPASTRLRSGPRLP